MTNIERDFCRSLNQNKEKSRKNLSVFLNEFYEGIFAVRIEVKDTALMESNLRLDRLKMRESHFFLLPPVHIMILCIVQFANRVGLGLQYN